MFPRRVRIGASVGLFAVVSVHGAFAQELLLQIRPRAGDTLRMRLDQETDYTGAGVTRTGVGPESRDDDGHVFPGNRRGGSER